MFSMEAMFAEQSERRRWEGVVAEWQAAYEDLKEENRQLRESAHKSAVTASGYLGRAWILKRALSVVDPAHPLVANGGKNELVRAATAVGENVYRNLENGAGDPVDQIIQAAGAFALPERPCVQDLQKHIESLRSHAMHLQGEVDRLREREKALEKKGWELMDDLIDYVAQREAMRAELARYDRDNQLVNNAELRQRISEAGRRAYAISGGDFKAVKEAGLTFRREHWAGSGDSK
jgi:FtsZ-binding cell division protein ZapB